MNNANIEKENYFDLIKFLIDNFLNLLLVSVFVSVLSFVYYKTVTTPIYQVKIPISSIGSYETSKYQIINNEYRKTLYENSGGYREIDDFISNENLFKSFKKQFNSKSILVKNFTSYYLNENLFESKEDARDEAIEISRNFEIKIDNENHFITFETKRDNINKFSELLIISLKEINEYIYDTLFTEIQDQIKNSLRGIEMSTRELDAKIELRNHEIIDQQKLKLQFLNTQLKIARDYKASDDFQFPSVSLGNVNESKIQSMSNFSLMSMYFLKGTEAILSEINDLEKKIESDEVIFDEQLNFLVSEKKALELEIHPHITLQESIEDFKKDNFRAVEISSFEELTFISMPFLSIIIIFNIIGFILYTVVQVVRQLYFK